MEERKADPPAPGDHEKAVTFRTRKDDKDVGLPLAMREGAGAESKEPELLRIQRRAFGQQLVWRS